MWSSVRSAGAGKRRYGFVMDRFKKLGERFLVDFYQRVREGTR
jgi:hypothetical protein